MRGWAVAVGAMASLLVATSPARAGVYTDDLSKCLVKSTSAGDQKALVFWIFMAMARHPDVKAYANITEPRRDEGDKTVAGIFQRLLTADCRPEAVAALKYEGTGALEPAFSVLGQVAMRGLMSEPGVEKGMTGVGAYVDETKFEALFKDAGLSPAPSK